MMSLLVQKQFSSPHPLTLQNIFQKACHLHANFFKNDSNAKKSFHTIDLLDELNNKPFKLNFHINILKSLTAITVDF